MRLSLFVLLFYSAWASKLAAQPDLRLKLCESIHNFTQNSKFGWKEKYKRIPPSIKFSVIEVNGDLIEVDKSLEKLTNTQ